MDRYWPSTAAFSALDPQPVEHMGTYPPELRVPDFVVLLTVDERRRIDRLCKRGESPTEEEHTLAQEASGRAAVLAAYRSFDTVEVDTSELGPDEVLGAVLALLAERGFHCSARRGVERKES